MTEVYYPRGGSKPKSVNNNIQKSDNLFNTLSKRKHKGKPKKHNNINDNDKETNFHLTSADVLTYDKILPGMKILGCIRTITYNMVHIELPGRTFAKVEINAISNILSRYLKKQLEDNGEQIDENILKILTRIFNKYQFLPIIVLNSEEDSNRIRASLNPLQINENLTSTVFTEGSSIWGCIAEKSDYVYIVEVGVKNARVMLPFDNCENRNYIIGEPLWLVVEQIESVDGVATVTVSTKQEKFCKGTQQKCPLNEVIPGTCVTFRVSKILKDGLEGVYFDNYLGYINQIYLTTPMDSLQKYEGATCKAYVLYINPMTKITYLTMRSLQSFPSEILPTGHICQAKITKIIGKGVIVQLSKEAIGLVTYKRLVRSLKLKPSSDLSEEVKREFPVGSTHECLVLDYIHMDMMYMCTFEKVELKQKIFSASDLTLGQLVRGTVDGIFSNGISVKIGKVLAFATNEHISDACYSETIKRKYYCGRKVIARVWHIENNGRVKLTLKQAFIDDENCLTSYQLAKRNAQYRGMVVKYYESGVLVRFYGDVKGFLKASNHNFVDMFYIGQAIDVTVISKGDNLLQLTLDSPETIGMQLGEIVNAKVESVENNGLSLRTTNNTHCKCFLPVQHLSVNTKLSTTMLDLYKAGDTLENLICIDKKNNSNAVVSRREYQYYESGEFRIPERNQLDIGMIVRCSVSKIDKTKLLLQSPIRSCNGRITVHKKDITDDINTTMKECDFVEGQAVVAKLTKVSEKAINATVKLSEVFNYDYKYGVRLLERYLTDLDLVREKLVENGDPLACQYKIGQSVCCRITCIKNIGCLVVLDDGTKGLVHSHLWPNKPVANSYHLGVILHINYAERYLEISLNKKINYKLNKDPKMTTNVTVNDVVTAKVLLVRPEFAVCSLGTKGNRQLGYVPSSIHENDFVPKCRYYENFGDSIKFIVQSSVNGKIIGIAKSSKKKLDQIKKTLSSERRLEIDNEIPSKKPRRHTSTLQSYTNGNETKNDSGDEQDDSDEGEEVQEEEIDVEAEKEMSEDIEYKEEKTNDYLMKIKEKVQKVEGMPEGLEIEELEEVDEFSVGVEDISSEEEEIEEKEEENDETDNESSREGNSRAENTNENENGCSRSSSSSCSSDDEEEEEEEHVDLNETSSKHDSVNNNNKKRKRISFCNVVEEVIFEPSGVDDFYNSDDEQMQSNANDDDDSDVEVIEENEQNPKKRTRMEKKGEALKREEEAIRRKELEFVDPPSDPQSAEQFDRCVLAEPDDSQLWTKYILFHLTSAEIDKARAVAKRALQTINRAHEQQRLNIWLTSLNIENSYGTKDSFLEVFNEAIQCNDEFKVFMNTIKMLSENPNDTFDYIIKRVRAKFKQTPKMYIEIGRIFYQMNRLEEARKLKDIALKTLQLVSEHIPLIVQFAIMEYNYGEEHQAEALFETILQSHPRRVDVWLTYVDQLIKKKKFEIAMRVLDRAVTQKLTPVKIRALIEKRKLLNGLIAEEEVDHDDDDDDDA